MRQTILVIEDEAVIRKDIARALELSGYDPLQAANGAEGFDMAMKRLPDLIISDILMPEIDGFGVLKLLQEHPVTSRIPFLFLSARSDKQDIRDGMHLGADDYITKPFDIDELLKSIETRLKKKHSDESFFKKKFDNLRQNIKLALPHELRTPLNIVLGYTELLSKHYETTTAGEAKEMLNHVYQAGKRLESLFEKYWSYVNLRLILENPTEIENLRLSKTLIVESIIKDVVNIQARKYNRFNDIQMSLIDAALVIREEHFIRAIQELIENSLKFSEKGTPIYIRSSKINGQYIVTIEDFGRGMSGEQIKHIGAYVQFDRDKYEQQGTGLGIAIVKSIIEIYNGNFKIESRLNKFTKITISFNIFS